MDRDQYLQRFKRYFLVAIGGWTLVIAGLLIWSIAISHQTTFELARNEAIANFNKDQAFRFWATEHGGVYVPVTEATPPNPHLQHVPERDISTASGQQLTLMNPAYMVRQLNEMYTELYGIRGHITSEKLMRPENRPDEWELKALRAFEQGAKEVMEVAPIEGRNYMRFMAPMYIQTGCLKCHAVMGFKVGDVRGGVSVAVPMESYEQKQRVFVGSAIGSYLLIWAIGSAGITVGWRRLRRDHLELVRANAAVAELNRDLEKRVEAEVRANREKDHLLIQQSRLAAMGEMIHNIAHQWRQPLNSLGIVLANIKDDFEYHELTAERLEGAVGRARGLLERMSSTIDDFRDFFRPDRQAADFDVGFAVQEALTLLDASLKNNQITIDKAIAEGITGFGYASQFAQVVVNLLVNAKEAIKAREGEAAGRIEVRLERRGDRAVLTVADDGGGIPAEVLPRIFDPYFTTKDQGSGIGLYMAKMILERNLEGTITAENLGSGALLTITIPAV